nr:EOG090X0FJX [Triops cancriformis]
MDIEDEAMQTEIQLSRLIEHCILAERRQQAETDDSALEVESVPDKSEPLSTSLIATNLPRAVFQDPSLKSDFENLFLGFDSTATFHYLKSFRRARVDFTSPTAAGSARIHLHQSVFAGSPVNVYFAQPIVLKSATAQQAYLQLPPPVRQFLISPPASPPVDWAPAPESEPIVNYDLLAALAKLGPVGLTVLTRQPCAREHALDPDTTPLFVFNTNALLSASHACYVRFARLLLSALRLASATRQRSHLGTSTTSRPVVTTCLFAHARARNF